eukprot:CAMPEP_0197662306 /NCGR_PEP_ID=MMETSP1338-20131121/52825_1 /TAXON_ID=43686 ORGANISM="Pelagodinium beii, Strain RCC1491" /NCGR_SAMPLE_ID=MMETSP1338 /ASSEMBLY_ACC=CAM_ASM_000754 /LENGTH=757 /DNA_ID=CAMNT_0043240083 /DNA_START=39 /DNA_END=2312 /DNA_ORIENTATION=+
MADLSATGGSAFGSSRVPPLDTKGMFTGGKPISSNDEVAAILKGLKLDKQFFTSKLNPDTLKALGPDEEDKKGKKIAAAGRTSDFDIYLNEAMMPVLAQALDALCRQIVRMEKQGASLDVKVRARFNPITWLAQQLLRRHPRAATTPRRLHIYRNFKDWADYERGRRELLRSKKQIEEVFSGFCIRGVVGRNTLPSVLQSADDTFRLRGALKDNKDIQQEVVGQVEQDHNSPQPAVRGRRRSMLGGDAVSFDQFWYKFANTVMKHDIVSYSALQAGKELQRLEQEENARREEAAKLEEERRARDDMEHQRCLGIYELLYPKMAADEALQSIINTGKTLTGDFLKEGDVEYVKQVAPKGVHVDHLEELLKLLGFEVERRESKAQSKAPGTESVDLGGAIFRQKVKHETKTLTDDKDKEKKEDKSKEKPTRNSIRRTSADEEPKAEEPAAPKPKSRMGSKQASQASGRFWDPVLKGAWAVMQEIHGVSKPDGNVDAKMLKQIMTQPENFINLRKKVETEFERRAESADGEGDDILDILKHTSDAAKPSMEELCAMLKMTRGRLDFFHDVFESFLPKTQDGEQGVCLYPEMPAAINKSTMRTLMGELQPGLDEDEFDARFRRIDDDGSGLIEFDEFVRWVHDDEVQVTGAAAKKMTFEELSVDLNMPMDLIQYIYSCFCESLEEDEVDSYPDVCFEMSLEKSFTLVGLLTPKATKKEFEQIFKMVDVARKGVVTFDEFLECVDTNLLPKELREKFNMGQS